MNPKTKITGCGYKALFFSKKEGQMTIKEYWWCMAGLQRPSQLYTLLS